MAIQYCQHALDEADEHHDLQAKGNNGSPIKHIRGPLTKSTAIILANTLGTVKAAEHTAKLVEDIRTTINNLFLWIISFANHI